MSKYPVLYSFRRCPYAMRARMAIAYANCSVELREILLKDKPQSMLDVSPKATVPVLVITNSDNQVRVIDESRDLMFWALKQSDPHSWYYGLSDNDQQLINTMIDTNDNQFKPLLDKYKYAVRFPQHSEQDYLDMAQPLLKELDLRLESSEFLISQHISLADIALFPFIRQFAFVNKAKFDLLGLRHLSSWLDTWLTSDLFNRVMTKYQPWRSDDQPLLFP